ncbi:MAG: DUF58 domain-containing protein [Phycisphaerae bacterium]|nr:DUF58 domain-containing protein [Phycisphaerae bacterium]
MKVSRLQSVKRLKTAVRLTASGNALVLSMGFVLLASVIIPAFGVLACLSAMLICSLIFGALFKPRVLITAKLPDQTTVGSDTKIEYSIQNTSRSHSFCLSLTLTDLPAGWRYAGQSLVVAHLKPMGTHTLHVTVTPTRRGLFTLPCPACYSSFPFHLFAFNVAQGPASSITVLPAYDTLQIDAPMESMTRQQVGARHSPSPSHLPEYAGNRPFLSGDSLRHIDSRAWARLAVPVVKEYHNDMQRHCAVWLRDHRKTLPPSQDWDCDFEAMVSLCASVAYSLRRDTVVDTLILGSESHDLRSMSPDMRLPCILELLAGVGPESLKEKDAYTVESCLNRVACVYALYLGDHEAMVSTGQAIEHRGVELHTLHVTQTPDLESWATTPYEHHLEIDTNAILARQIHVL